MSKKTIILLKTIIFFILLIAVFLLSYLVIIPAVISNSHFIALIESSVQKTTNVELKITNPKLKTSFSPRISFNLDALELQKNNEKIVDVKKFNTTITFKQLFKKRIDINKLGADYIFVDINKLNYLSTKQEEKETTTQPDWHIDLLHSLLYIKESVILYELPNNVNIKVSGKDLKITETRNPKFVKFNINVEIEKNKEKLTLAINDNDSVFIDQKKLFVKDCAFYINQSPILINYVGAENQDFAVTLHSTNFKIKDVVDVVNTNLLIPNGEELLAMLSDIDGSFDFKVEMNNAKTTGELNLHSFSFKVPMFNNIPVLLNKGRLHISGDKILLNDFKGFYGRSNENSIDMTGTIDDYMNSFKTDVVAYVVGTKELTNDYLSQTIGFPLELVGKTTAKVKFGMIDNKIDLAIIFRLIKGYDILVDGSSLSPINYERAFRADMQLDGTNLELKNLNYYIADSFQAGVVAKPILKLYGNFDIAKNMDIKNLGFEIPKPLPSEFLNLLLGERVFRKGTISGHLEYLNNKLIPYLDGHLAMNGVLVPSQRLSIREGNIKTSQNNTIDIDIKGRYKRADYKFDGYIANQLTLPIVVNKINMKIDNIDVERIMQSFNKQAEQTANVKDIDVAKNLAATAENENISDDEVVFNTNLIIIEDCLLEIVKGSYKEMDFSNVQANMTLDKNGVLQLNSNRFNIADGISSAKVFCDLKNQKYDIKLGIKDVNADKIATSLLALPREISGKAKGLIHLETDSSLKLNGKMKFDIKNGVIAKIGLVEYAIKFVSLFRNPLAMLTPATVIDLVNIPEGDFDNINGELILKNNVIEKIMIKSTAPQLSSFIIGKYDLETRDATLRVYTKFSNKDKGFSGFLRNISLNSLANRISLGSRNDRNYYATELSFIPPIDADEKDCQIFLTKIDGDVERNNFLSSLKRIK